MADTRLFFALWPDERQRDRLQEILEPLTRQASGIAVPRDNWHVTLVFVGRFPRERLADLHAAARRIEMQPVRLRFDRFSYWQRPRIGCLEAATVPPTAKRLAASLADVAAGLGIDVENRRYRPHLTAVRKARPFRFIRLARPLELAFDGFELVESVPTSDGVRYRPLKQELPPLS